MVIHWIKEPGDADVVVVNTCGFIQSAKEEAIETILELAELKKEGTIQKIILTGCLTERYQEEVADQFAEVDAVVGIGDQKDIVSILESVLKKDRVVQFAPKSDAELMGDRIITTLPFYSYLKLQRDAAIVAATVQFRRFEAHTAAYRWKQCWKKPTGLQNVA